MKYFVGKIKSLAGRIRWFIKKPRRYEQIYQTIRKIKPIRIMEIGTWTGARAVKMIRLAQKESPGREIEYYGFDLFEEMTEQDYHKELSKKPPSLAEVKGRLTAETNVGIYLIKGNTLETLKENLDNLPKMDLIFIDGGHSLVTVQSDWNNTKKLMGDETVVVFDDYWIDRIDAGAKQIVDSIDQSVYTIEILPVVDHFTNTDFGELNIKLAKVMKRT